VFHPSSYIQENAILLEMVVNSLVDGYSHYNNSIFYFEKKLTPSNWMEDYSMAD
jgi:hypothetical protein